MPANRTPVLRKEDASVVGNGAVLSLLKGQDLTPPPESMTYTTGELQSSRHLNTPRLETETNRWFELDNGRYVVVLVQPLH